MDKYVFNWNAVLAHCPEYKKYLVDVESLKDDDEEELIIPEVRNWRHQEVRTEEELEVIKQMNGKEDICRDAYQAEQEEIVERDLGPVYTLNPIYLNQPLSVKMNPLQLLPPKCVLDVGSKMFFPGKTGWHMNYQILGNEHKDGSVNMIKTKVNETEDKIQLINAIYWFHQAKNVMSDRSGRFKCLTYNKKTRCLYYVYRTPKKGGKSKKSQRYRSNVKSILFNQMTINTATSGIEPIMMKSFVDIVEKAVLKDVPNAYALTTDEPKSLNRRRSSLRIVVDAQVLNHLDYIEFLRNRLLVLLLQHKANARLDWLNNNVLGNISRLLSIQEFEDRVTGIINNVWESSEHIKHCKNRHTNRVRKIVPALRNKKSLKALTKAVCGKFYSQIFIKLMSAIDLDNRLWIDILRALYYKHMPKFLYHWLSNILSDGVEGKELTEKVIREILLTMNDTNCPKEHIRNITIAELWVKTCKRFLSNGGHIVSWFTWRDMYNMADRLSIRLRPNKMEYAVDVHRQHDLLAELTNRNRSMLRDYADVVFREFTIPDEEYNGFEFVQLQTTEELVNEGQTMHHCVGGYSDRCVSGRSILFSMRKGDRGYVTIELDGTTFPYGIRQQYTIDDIRVTSEFALELINKWLEDVRELHKEDKMTYSRECENASNKMKAEHRLQKLAELKEKADDETLAHINNECAELERQLATSSMENAKYPPLHAETAMNLQLDDIEDALGVLRG
jgi:hypothetical protein